MQPSRDSQEQAGHRLGASVLLEALTLGLCALAFAGLPRCVTLLPLECGCATDVISRIPLAS